MNFLKKYKWYLLGALILTAFFLFSRLIRLTELPIFTDEAIYLRWAQTAKNDANWRFISLTDGKQPLYIWITMIAMKFILDPLVAGRVVSVIAGLLSMFLIGLVTWEIFHHKKAAIFASVIYFIYPSALFYDRMALMDGLLATTMLLTLYLEVKLIRNPRLDTALILGMALGAAMLTKTSGFFSLYLVPFFFVLFDFKSNHKLKRLLKTILLFIISVLLSQIYYAVLRLSPFFHMIGEKDVTFIYSFKDWLQHPLQFFLGNFTGMWSWFVLYFSWPVVFLMVFALLFSWKNFFRERWLLLVCFLAPFMALALFGKVLYPRFIFFMTMPAIILAASFYSEITAYIRNKYWQIFIVSLILIPSLIFSGQILTEIKTAPLTQIDRGQYVNDWPAGWGVNEAVAILKKEAEKGKIAIYTDGTFGLLPYAIELYLVYNKNVLIKGLWPITDTFPAEMATMAKTKPTFFIANYKQIIPDSWSVTLIGKWQKGNNDQSYLRLYKIVSMPNTTIK